MWQLSKATMAKVCNCFEGYCNKQPRKRIQLAAQVHYSSNGKLFSCPEVKQTRNLQLRLEAAEGCEIQMGQEPKDGRLSLRTSWRKGKKQVEAQVRSSVAKNISQTEVEPKVQKLE